MANDNVVAWPGITRLDVPAEQVLDAAKETCTDTAVVMGYDEDGDFRFYSSAADGGTVLWLLETARKRLLESVDE